MTKETRFEIRSQNGGMLAFTVMEVFSPDDIGFLAEVACSEFRGSVVAHTYLNGPPSALFEAINAEWRGWSGEKSWSSTDGNLRLSATGGSRGEITLRVEMHNHPQGCSLSVSLVLDGGSMQRSAHDMKNLFAADSRLA